MTKRQAVAVEKVSLTREDINAMGKHVAQAIHAATGATETWDDMTDEERAEFVLIAFAAMGAHDAWLAVQGYSLVRIEKGGPIKRLGLVGPDGKPLN